MATESVEATERLSPAAESAGSRNEQLRKQGWYFGEMTEETASAILKESELTNSFVVFCEAEGGTFTLSMRCCVEGMVEDLIEHLPITCMEEGTYQLTGTTEVFPDVVGVVNSYVSSREPPLVAALGGRGFETQISLTEAPPDYDRANRVLKPDIAPLPDIGSVRLEDISEAKVGNLSPTSSMRRHGYGLHGYRSTSAPDHLTRSHWHRYPEHGRCHPKNCCHGCCHRATYWSGYREVTRHKWYNPRGSGPLRVLGLLLFWLLCGCCFGIGKAVLFCCQLCFFCCCYDDS